MLVAVSDLRCFDLRMSGPRGAGVAIAIVGALVLIGLIIVAAGPAIAFDEATSGYE